MLKIKGIPVVLCDETITEYDDFNNPVVTETETTVNNVLVGEPTSDDVISATELYGKKAVYTLAIPKGDSHSWENKKVKFFGKTFRAFGETVQGIETMIPLEWNKKVKVEIYEQ